MTNETQTTAPTSDRVVKTPGYTKFPNANQALTKSYISGQKSNRKRYRGDSWCEHQPCVLVEFRGISAWAQRTEDQQGWFAYTPNRGQCFQGVQTQTLKQALRAICGWFGLSNDQAMEVLHK